LRKRKNKLLNFKKEKKLLEKFEKMKVK